MWRLFWRILFLVFNLLQFAQMLGVLWDQLFIFKSFFSVHFITIHSSHFYSTVYRLNPLKRTEHIQNATQKVLKEYSMNEKVTCICDGQHRKGILSKKHSNEFLQLIYNNLQTRRLEVCIRHCTRMIQNKYYTAKYITFYRIVDSRSTFLSSSLKIEILHSITYKIIQYLLINQLFILEVFFIKSLLILTFPRKTLNFN